MCKRKPVSEKKQNLGSKVLVVQKKNVQDLNPYICR